MIRGAKNRWNKVRQGSGKIENKEVQRVKKKSKM
jgi:hypothetical protein